MVFGHGDQDPCEFILFGGHSICPSYRSFGFVRYLFDVRKLFVSESMYMFFCTTAFVSYRLIIGSFQKLSRKHNKYL